MTRRKNWIEAFAVVRRDHFPGHEHEPDQASPPLICGGEFSYRMKEVIVDLDAATREVEPLNAVADKCRDNTELKESLEDVDDE